MHIYIWTPIYTQFHTHASCKVWLMLTLIPGSAAASDSPGGIAIAGKADGIAGTLLGFSALMVLELGELAVRKQFCVPIKELKDQTWMDLSHQNPGFTRIGWRDIFQETTICGWQSHDFLLFVSLQPFDKPCNATVRADVAQPMASL